MTYRQFAKRVRDIEQEPFRGSAFHPLDIGIERSFFEEAKLNRLLVLARSTNLASARRREINWLRRIDRVRSARERLQAAKTTTRHESALQMAAPQ